MERITADGSRLNAKVFVRVECPELYGEDVVTFEQAEVNVGLEHLPNCIKMAVSDLGERAANYAHSVIDPTWSLDYVTENAVDLGAK